ncbi:MAG: D-alanyl-D-alanine dipeptidase, partial [Gemmatimonadota bacterium]|nr:D-alanyl-D-alanine dipeptidase [Gemmatimonadota bacterium]
MTPTRPCILAAVALLALWACAPPADDGRVQAESSERPAETRSSPEPDLVDVTELEPSIRTDIRYAGSENFV